MTLRNNIITQTDAYKLSHWAMLADGTTRVFEYLEARSGGAHLETLWFGLQYYLHEYLEGVRVTKADIEEALDLQTWLMPGTRFNKDGWERIRQHHGGRLPLRICAAPEGMVIPVSNALMTMVNTDPAVPGLPGHVESLLMKTWYTTAVATLTFHQLVEFRAALVASGCDPAFAAYMLHDFGYRGGSSEETTRIGGMAHMAGGSKGTDTLEAIRTAMFYYGAPAGIAASVAASEHSIMTQKGKAGEHGIGLHLIATHQNQILSEVADSYHYYDMVDFLLSDTAQDLVKRHKVRLVIRPDSVTTEHPTPAALVLWTLARIDAKLGHTLTPTGHKVLPVGVLWGDGLTPLEITEILWAVVAAGYSASNVIYGMGGGLLQKVNRDTDRVAIKCSAQEQDGVWVDIMKNPLDSSKKSKPGRLILTYTNGIFETRPEGYVGNVLAPVFEDGVVLSRTTWGAVAEQVARFAHEKVVAPPPMAVTA